MYAFYLHILRILFSGLQGIAVQDILRVGNGLCILPNGTEQYRCVRYDNLVQFPMGRNRQRASRRTPQHERRIHLCHDIYLPVKRLCQLLLPSVLHQGARRETSTRNGADEGKRDRLAVATQLAETANQQQQGPVLVIAVFSGMPRYFPPSYS